MWAKTYVSLKLLFGTRNLINDKKKIKYIKINCLPHEFLTHLSSVLPVNRTESHPGNFKIFWNPILPCDS